MCVWYTPLSGIGMGIADAHTITQIQNASQMKISLKFMTVLFVALGLLAIRTAA